MGSSLFFLVKKVVDSTTKLAPAWPMGVMVFSNINKTHFQSSKYKMKTEKKRSDGFLTEDKGLCLFFLLKKKTIL